MMGANMAHSLSRSIGSAALAAGTGILADGNTVVQTAVVPTVGNLCKVGVEGRGYIGRQTEGVGKALTKLHILCIAQHFHKVLESIALHAGNALGTDLFLVGKDADSGLFGSFDIEDGLQLGIGADTIL